MSNAKHTPTPWTNGENGLIYGFIDAESDNGAPLVCDVIIANGSEKRAATGATNDEEEANAVFIVRAVNAHEALLEALAVWQYSLSSADLILMIVEITQ